MRKIVCIKYISKFTIFLPFFETNQINILSLLYEDSLSLRLSLIQHQTTKSLPSFLSVSTCFSFSVSLRSFSVNSFWVSSFEITLVRRFESCQPLHSYKLQAAVAQWQSKELNSITQRVQNQWQMKYEIRK